MRSVASGVYSAVREAGHQFLEGFEGFAGCLGVALGGVLRTDVGGQAEVFVEVDQALQVIDVIDRRVAGVQLDEAIAGSQGRAGFVTLPVDIAQFELRLLGVTAVREAGFQFFQVLGRLVPGTISLGILGFRIQFAGRPAAGFVVSICRATTGDDNGNEGSQQYTNESGARRECG